MTDFRLSARFQEVLKALPEELRNMYEALGADYSWATASRYGRGYVAYEALADLVCAGWRKEATEEPRQ